MFFTALLAGVTLISSCSTDDYVEGGGGAPIIPIVRSTLYAASNASGTIGVYDFTPQGVDARTHEISSNKNDGIYYDKGADELIVGSIAQRGINIYGNVKSTPGGGDLYLEMSSNTAIRDPHDIAMKDNMYIVSDGELDTDEGRFYVFERNEEGLQLRNIVTVEYDVWGIYLLGDDLYSVVANTGDVAVFKNFLSTYTTDVVATPNKRITLEGIQNIRGITADDGFFLFTDVGEVSNPSDGAFHMINGFVQLFNAAEDGGVLPLIGNQVRVSGHMTKLGDPLDIAYDNQSKIVFVAENIKEGGAVLLFPNVEAGGELPPNAAYSLKGASSVYFAKR